VSGKYGICTEKRLPPDRPPTVVYDMYPAVGMAPYHYKNPVTAG
jgi:hypothetical protein